MLSVIVALDDPRKDADILRHYPAEAKIIRVKPEIRGREFDVVFIDELAPHKWS